MVPLTEQRLVLIFNSRISFEDLNQIWNGREINIEIEEECVVTS